MSGFDEFSRAFCWLFCFIYIALRVLRILEGSRNSMGDRSFSHSNFLNLDQNIRNYSKFLCTIEIIDPLIKGLTSVRIEVGSGVQNVKYNAMVSVDPT